MDKTSDSDLIILEQGYGAFLTKLTFENGIIIKKSINNQGNSRIEKEINFYNFIKDSSFNIYVPKLINSSVCWFSMEYLNGYVTAEKYLRLHNADNKNCQYLLESVKTILNSHLYYNNIDVDLNIFTQNLYLETTLKISGRLKTIDHIVRKYDNIHSVNGLKILKIDIILNKINEFIEEYVKSCELKYYPIHGDLQLNNILINTETDEIRFIDPRGYFGNSDIYGMKEYDLAKIYFGMGGYSYFDLKNVTKLNIENDNIQIDMKEMNNILEHDNIIKILIISIWLGNAHCFISNEYKVVESYFYSLYLATIVTTHMDI